MNANRVNYINSLKGALRHMELKKNEYERIDILCQEKAKLIKPSGIFLIFSGIVLWLFFTFIFTFLFEDFPSFLVWLLFVSYGIVVPVVIYKKEKKMFDKRLYETEKELKSLNDSIKEHFLAYYNFPVVFDYSNPIVLKNLINIMEKGRADSIKEAINCRLNDIHRVAVMKSQLEFEKQDRERIENIIGRGILGILGIFWLGD